MPLKGQAFIALWNDRSPSRRDYDVWHTREHVPQRLTVPGITYAVRYVDGEGPLPRYFSLYALDDLSVLRHPDYVRLQQNPTSWTLSMRPDFSRFLRLPCAVARSAGGGVGGWCVAGLVRGASTDADIAALTDALVDLAPVIAVHVGRTDPDLVDVPFSIELDAAPTPYGVLVVEGFLDGPLIKSVREVVAAFEDRVVITDLTAYKLAFALQPEDVPDVPPFDQSEAGQGVGQPS